MADLEKPLEKVTIVPIIDVSKDAHALYISPVISSSNGKISAWSIRKLTFKLPFETALRAFTTEYPVVAQGRDFGMYFRLENTGALIVRSVDIEVRGKKQSGDGDPEVKLKKLHIDMSSPSDNAVTHYERDPSAANYTTVGEHTIYRLTDVRDSYNGETVKTTVYSGSQTESQIEYLKALLPGAVRTYKTTVTNSPTKWHGKYALFGKIVEMYGTLMVGEYNDGTVPLTFHAVWDDATDSFNLTLLNADPSPSTGNTTVDPVALLGTGASDLTNYGNAGMRDVDGNVNDALNATLTRNDELYANINYNDLQIDADTITVNGEENAVIILRNDTQPTAPSVTPRLTAKIITATGEEKTTYTHALKTSLTGGFTRTLTIPMSTLSGGQPYAGMRLYVDSADGKSYFEINEQSTVVSLDASSYFSVAGPDDQTVEENNGRSATFTVTVGGSSTQKYTYQWRTIYPDGTETNIGGATSPTLTIANPQYSQNGLQYQCAVSDGNTIEFSRIATLTVIKHVPVTGDSSQPILWVALLLLSAAAVGLTETIRRRRSATR